MYWGRIPVLHNSVVVGVLPELSNHHLYQSRTFHHPQKETPYPSALSPESPFLATGNHFVSIAFFRLCNFHILGISFRGNHTICGFCVWPLWFGIVFFKMHLCCSMCPNSIPFLWLNNIPSYGYIMGFPRGSDGKESACNAGDLVSVPFREDPLEKGMATLSSILAWRIIMDRRAWQATVHGVTQSWTQLSTAQP